MSLLHRWRMSVVCLALGYSLVGCGSPSAAAPAAEPLNIHSEAAPLDPITISSEMPTPEVATPTLPVPFASPIPTRSKEADAAALSQAPSDAEPENGTVLAQLASVEVKGRAPKTGYDRDLFGDGWKDPDRNGCDSRNDILGRDLRDVATKPGTHGCLVTKGILDDPFTGQLIEFERGQDTSSKVQIDHLVPLSDAWQKGAQQMSTQERLEFANDPLNLLAVDGSTNASKSDADAATWLPPNKGFRCDYVARQTAVKAKYGLWMTKSEHKAIEDIITRQCAHKKALPTTK